MHLQFVMKAQENDRRGEKRGRQKRGKEERGWERHEKSRPIFCSFGQETKIEEEEKIKSKSAAANENGR